ncbi:tRNA (N6-threonylcarbamoyladenosine(37)-N6)-methyltransferase TrmO [uncultured Mailhella sp.]|uniref:tRNA (N6-threonylcarbamoyladenosine(37)-N6)-methyltransferase TrmO n=1 Tax=uncultured Mailhella sp. TaxID=1981031 RepID=UPI00261AB98A|nr:tRNA (N6-threonylcarbamoyladenosine(37)-N6)-methyltransferase TrmO [uncultured Mailhella sp.]
MGYSARMNIIAHIHTDLPEKFGVPRQSGLVDALEGRVIFTPEYRVPEALRGLEGFSHIWLLWLFSRNVRESWTPTVRPPRLGGNTRLGVFATRSPFRPNGIGLSCVRLESVELESDAGPVLHVAGVDMLDGTPIVDIKPYVPYADSRPEARGGFTDGLDDTVLEVDIPEDLRRLFSPIQLEALKGILAGDPRPRYQHDGTRVYAMTFGGSTVRFRVKDGRVEVLDVLPLN